MLRDQVIVTKAEEGKEHLFILSFSEAQDLEQPVDEGKLLLEKSTNQPSKTLIKAE